MRSNTEEARKVTRKTVIKRWNFGLKLFGQVIGKRYTCFWERGRWVCPCCEGTTSTCKEPTRESKDIGVKLIQTSEL